MSLIVERFIEICAEYKDKPAFVFAKKGELVEKSFCELERDVRAAVGYLSDMGVRRGERILTFALPSYELCTFMLASMSLGASLMYVDSWADQKRLRGAFEQYRPECILVSRATAKIRLLLREMHSIKRVLYVDKEINEPTVSVNAFSEDIPEETVALLTLTTGSTGRPKAAIRTHGQLHEQLMLVCNNMEMKSREEYVLTTSFMYVFSNILSGFTTVLPCLRLGRSSPAKLYRKLALFCPLPISMIITTPDFCLSVSNRFPTLRRLYLGGAILTPIEAERIYEKFRPSEITYIYGATECNLIASTRLEDYVADLKRGRSVLGRAVEGVQIRIGENCEIMVSAMAMLDKYLDASAANKETDENNLLWHKTGDAGELCDGKLVYFGRCDKRLPGRDVIYSSQLEQRICVRFKDIEKCAVCVDKQGEHKIWVFAVCRDGGKFECGELCAYVREQLPEREIVIRKLSKMPCDVKHHTKINYNALQKKMK